MQTTAPLAVRQARQYLNIALPDTATNVQFARYRNWLAVLDFIRFEAPSEDCLATAKTILAQHNANNPDMPVAGLSASLNPDWVVDDTSPLTVPWFDPDTIPKGQSGGNFDSQEPVVWVDTVRGIFYYQLTD